MVIYFSGTGNSRYAAEVIASELGDEIQDAGAYIKAGERGIFSSERPWVFVAPTYCWQMPRLFAEFIRKSRFSGTRNAYFVLTCGAETGNARAKTAGVCKEKGFIYKGLLEVVMPENYVALFSVPEESECRRLTENAVRRLKDSVRYIREGKSFPSLKAGILDRIKSSSLLNAGFYGFAVKAKKFYATDECISCGKCVKSCMLNNIRLINGKPEWGKRCTHCMACISVCPTEAVQYGKHTAGKRRYLCHEKATEIF